MSPYVIPVPPPPPIHIITQDPIVSIGSKICGMTIPFRLISPSLIVLRRMTDQGISVSSTNVRDQYTPTAISWDVIIAQQSQAQGTWWEQETV